MTQRADLSQVAEVVKEVRGRQLPRYPTYKPSGVQWLEDIPESWSVERLRFVAGINPTKSEIRHLTTDDEVSFVPMEALHEYGGMSLDQTRLLGQVEQGYTYFNEGDIVIAKITPCFENGKGSVAVGLVNGIGFGTTELHVLRAKERLHRDYLFYLTVCHSFRKNGTAEMYGAGGQKRVPDSFIRDLRTPIPPLEEQKAIAAFLDRETAEIDALIAKKRRLIELLKEKRTALISHVVTKGLNPKAAMKPSGIDWLGDVPAHWEIKQLKYAVTFQRGHDLPLDDRTDGDVPIITSAGSTGCHYCAAAKAPGIVTGRYGTVGEFYLIDTDYWPLNTTLYSIDLRGNIPRFLWYMLHNVADMFLINSGKSAVPGVDRNDLHPIAVAVPPKHEQAAIAAYLDGEFSRSQRLTTQIEEVVRHLNEYRSALISAAVTGKIDVRNEVS